MNATTTLLRENPSLVVMLALVVIGGCVFALIAGLMSRSGASLRPIVFVGGLFALVVLPQFAYHLGIATGAIPRRSLTWMPSSDQASVYGWRERESALAVRDGAFADPAAVFGPGVDVAMGSDPRAAGPTSPFAAAQAACLVVLPPDGSAIVARFESPAAMEAAAREYARQALGFWPEIGKDGLRTATRPVGDIVKVATVGRTLVLVSGNSERAVTKQLLTLGAIEPGSAPSDPGSERFWLYRPGVLPALLLLLVAAFAIAFFKGAHWAAAVPPVAGVAAVPDDELRRRLLAVQIPDVPLVLTEEEGRLVATWRFADARWLDLARARQLRYVHRVILELDPFSHRVRVTEQMTRFDASLGAGGAAMEWRTIRGLTFFHTDEMKAPLMAVVTRAGWQWAPAPWSGPAWLRWLTD